MRRKIVVGNWKMYKTPGEALRDFNAFVEIAGSFVDAVDTGFSASFTSLPILSAARGAGVAVYAQNCHWEKEGAFTGEVSTGMLKELNVRGAVIGHSERRQFFGETNATAGKRVGALLREGMEAIFCIGETLAERERGDLEKVLRAQVEEGIAASGLKTRAEFIGSNPARPLLSVAYEPVWAIGTGKAATSVEAQEAHAFVRKLLVDVLGSDMASLIRIMYGGSVNPQNVEGFMKCPDIDGALVGGASLKAQGFAELCEKASHC